MEALRHTAKNSVDAVQTCLGTRLHKLFTQYLCSKPNNKPRAWWTYRRSSCPDTSWPWWGWTWKHSTSSSSGRKRCGWRCPVSSWDEAPPATAGSWCRICSPAHTSQASECSYPCRRGGTSLWRGRGRIRITIISKVDSDTQCSYLSIWRGGHTSWTWWCCWWNARPGPGLCSGSKGPPVSSRPSRREAAPPHHPSNHK